MPNASKQHCSYYLATSDLPTLPYYAPDLQLLLASSVMLYYCSLFTECLLLLLSPVLFLCYKAVLVLLFLIISAPTLQQIRVPVLQRGLLDISTARYFYKVSKTILHKPTAISGINIFYNKCSYKHYLHLL